MLSKKLEKPIDKDLESRRKSFIENASYCSTEKKDTWKMINIRITSQMIDEIDEIIQTERIGMNRTSWILEAIQEKLKRDE
jgi:hypothetical protein